MHVDGKRVEYEGEVGVDTQLLDDLLEGTRTRLEAVGRLAP